MFAKGDEIVITREHRAEFASAYGYASLNEGDVGIITSVRSANTYSVRFPGHSYVVSVSGGDMAASNSPEYAERKAEAERVAAEKKAAEEAEKARLKALATPKDGDILPDDPRLAWLWHKIEQDSDVQGYCYQYDRLVDKFGIPGREREFRFDMHLNGVDLSATIKARSSDLAKAAIKEKFPDATGVKVRT